MFKIDKSFKTGDIVGINPKDMNHTFILCDYELGIVSGYINILKLHKTIGCPDDCCLLAAAFLGTQ